MTIINNDLKTSMLEYIQAVQEFISFLEKDDEEYKKKILGWKSKKEKCILPTHCLSDNNTGGLKSQGVKGSFEMTPW